MKTEIIQTLTTTFEAHAQQTESGIEYWLARDLQHLLGYDEWRNYVAVIAKAKTACEVSGHSIRDHFVDVNKTIQMPKSAEKEIPDLMLTRYACYLIGRKEIPQKPGCFGIGRVNMTPPVSIPTLRACLKIPRGAVLGEKVGWRGATRENTLYGSSTEEQRSQTAFSAETLGAAGLSALASVGSGVAARCGDAPPSPPWPNPKSLAAAPRGIFRQALKDSLKVRSANGAVSYQPGATPQVHVHQMEQGPSARPITGGFDSSHGVAPRGWDGPSALGFVWASFPGALPQAGMGAHLWCLGKARALEQTIVGSLPLPLGEDRGEGAQRMAEILEA